MSSTESVVARLRAAGCVFAEDEAALLLAATDDPAQLDALVARRVDGQPLEHLLGWVEFRGLRIAVAPDVFVPRRRSEFLVAEAARHTPAGAVVLDLCCGCGALGVALREQVADVELHATDVDAAAVAVARRNVGDGGTVYRGDLFDALPTSLHCRVATIIANVPYVPSAAISTMPPEARDHEPHHTLDGGPDGLDVLRAVAAQAPDWLAADGHLFVETSEAQAALAADVFERHGLAAHVAHSDELAATVVIGSLAPRRS